MKTVITGLLKGRGTRWGLLAGVVATAGLSLAWMLPTQYQLGGAFIGSGGGIVWSAFQIPLDSAGRTAAVRVTPFNWGPDMAALLASFGADTFTESAGQARMTTRDTAKGVWVGCGTKQGNPPLICLLYVMSGTVTYTGPDTIVVQFTFDVYPGPANALGLPNADADGDGYPDPGTTPALSFPGQTATGKRVPMP